MKQKGFVLVTVLIITTITTMLAFSQLSDNRLQERVAGNQQKEISARLAAEKGIFNAFNYIKVQRELGLLNEDIIDKLTQLNKVQLSDKESYSFPSEYNPVSSEPSIITVVSQGEFGGATAYLKTVIKTTTSAEGIFDTAIIASESVRVWGSGSVDSYSIDANGNRVTGNKGDVSVKGGIENITYKDGSIKGDISEYKGEFDPLGITTLISDIAATGGTTRTNYSNADVFSDGNVYVYDNFDVKNNDIVITGDVILYIKGDMTTKNTIFTRTNTSSSLTIYIKGTISVDTGSNIFEDEYVSSGSTPLTVYSSNNTDQAVTLSGNGDIYMNLYAPLGTVAYRGNGNILGAIRANVVDISGNGGIHYDEGLGGLGAAVSVSYCAIYYYYPGDTSDSIIDSGYCGYSGDILFCGYSPHSYYNQYSEYTEAVATTAVAKAIDAAATAASTAIAVAEAAAAKAIEVAAAGTATPAETAATTAAVAAAAASTTRCTEFAAAAELRWIEAAKAARIADAAGATDAQKIATAEVAQAIEVAATAAAQAIDVAATAAVKAVAVAAAAVVEIAAAPADERAALTAQVAATLAETTAATAAAAVKTAAEVEAIRADKVVAVALAEATGISTTTVIIPTSTDTQNKNFWTTTDITITTTVDNNGNIIEKITVNKLISYKKGDITGTTTTTTTVDENGNVTETTT